MFFDGCDILDWYKLGVSFGEREKRQIHRNPAWDQTQCLPNTSWMFLSLSHEITAKEWKQV